MPAIQSEIPRFARNDKGLVLRRMTGWNSFTAREAFRKAGGRAAFSPSLTRPWRPALQG